MGEFDSGDALDVVDQDVVNTWRERLSGLRLVSLEGGPFDGLQFPTLGCGSEVAVPVNELGWVSVYELNDDRRRGTFRDFCYVDADGEDEDREAELDDELDF